MTVQDIHHDDLKNNIFKIIVTGHNTSKWARNCITSIKNQTYKNFKCLIIDDHSIDDSANIICDCIRNDNRFKLAVNDKRKYALWNIVNGINFLRGGDDTEIIVQIDGDDWLYDKDVLEKLNKVYNNSNIWLTYGQFIKYPSNEIGWCQRYFSEVMNKKLYRENIWVSSQLRTFRYFLWDNIKDDDLRDKNGKYYKIVWDLAMMFPMMEMCESKNIYTFTKSEDVLYVYNMENPNNDFKNHLDEIQEIEVKLRKMPKYSTLVRSECE